MYIRREVPLGALQDGGDGVSIDEFISCMGVVLYGKERFFRQENALWYDRNYADYVSTAEVLKRIYEQCDKELSL